MSLDMRPGMTIEGDLRPPVPINEPVLKYEPGSPERADLRKKLDRMASEVIEIPIIIGGQDYTTGDTGDVVMPHDHAHVLAHFHKATDDHIQMAIDSCMEAWKEWSSWSWQDRAAVFLKAADLLAGDWRQILNASTMLGQSKTCYQAEIDSACEIIDFWRFNVHYARELQSNQPISVPGEWNMTDYRPLEGFVYAISPFNFTSIGANLPTAPALMGNVSIWKPARTSLFSSYYLMRLLQEAGLPAGVINFLPGNSGRITDRLVASPHLAGIHFTGSTEIFQLLWKKVAENLENYRSYPRIVGETGGKDFIVAHPSADADAVATAMVRGAFEYQGQKCSAASRAYVPESLWPRVKDTLGRQLGEIRMGDPRDFENFVCAVIDASAFKDITGYIEHAKTSPDAEILFGGGYSDEEGYFIEPTLILARDPKFRTMCEEIFGPVLTVHVYPDADWSKTLDLVDSTSPYALTGAVFSRDRAATREAMATLRGAAGNFYVNDKPTGAVVGQQPFGGARASGTNDKAGSFLNLVRWVSPRSIKETFVPPTDFRYPYMKAGVGDSMEELGHKLGEQMGEIREHLGVLGGTLRERFGSVVEKAREDTDGDREVGP
ncbi:MAG: L-glutamate gamma-semialdehyde dehydrogenase [Candidatus Palauibacterales bacterium]|nr:L-glutamate gamma-semialdehyde dehydrogenase [Candidatus Palauibacterales bacterium]